MSNVCPKCGVPMPEGTTVCPLCGASLEQPKAATSVKFNLGNNYWAIAGLALATFLALLCFVTAIVDSSTFINRLYTTALMWNLPLITVALVAYGFYKGEAKKVGILSVVLLVVAFFCSNVMKNSVQDAISNAENYVEVAKEAAIDVIEDAKDWQELIIDAGTDISKAVSKNKDLGDLDLLDALEDFDYDDYDEDYGW